MLFRLIRKKEPWWAGKLERRLNMLMTRQSNKAPAVEKVDRLQFQVEKRQDERIPSHAPLIVSLFSTRLRHEYASMTFNHSKEGMCIELTEPFNPGTVLFIRLNTSPDDQIYHNNREHLRTSTLGEVRWRREYRDKFSTYYRLGIKYY
jgi:hypothetical protein